VLRNVHPSSSKGKPAPLQLEAEIRDRRLKGAKKQDVRLTKAKPLVEAFFTWVADTAADTGILPSNPMSKALAYAQKRRGGGWRSSSAMPMCP
jgi:hypothetical protein